MHRNRHPEVGRRFVQAGELPAGDADDFVGVAAQYEFLTEHAGIELVCRFPGVIPKHDHVVAERCLRIAVFDCPAQFDVSAEHAEIVATHQLARPVSCNAGYEYTPDARASANTSLRARMSW